jgi:lysophospholipase L1-like esterase
MSKMQRCKFLAALCLLLAAPQARGATDTAATLANVARKLSVDKKLVIGYIGGSITAGGGISTAGTDSWRALTTAWFKKTYPQAAITEIDASISSTGSDLGAFRCTRDLTSRNPDLVFIEFSVNDWQDSKAGIQPYCEGMIRNILLKNPRAGIIYIHTVHNNTAPYYDKGQFPPAVQSHQEVMDYYGLPSINVGKKLYDAIKSGQGTWESLTADGTHPTVAGYKIYANEIQRVLQKHLVGQDPAAFVNWPMPAAFLTPKPVDNGKVVPASEVTAAGWSKTSVQDNRFPNGIESNRPGTVLRYAFTGTAIGVHWNESPQAGDVSWSVDGSAPVRHSAYLSKGRGRLAVFTNSLSPGSHELVLTILSERNASSSGTWIRINAMMSNPPVATTGLASPGRIAQAGKYGPGRTRLLSLSQGKVLFSRSSAADAAFPTGWMTLDGRLNP